MLKLFLFLKYFKKENPDLIAAVGDFILAIAAKKIGFPIAIFYDGFDFKLNYQISSLIGDILIVPYPLLQKK